MTGIFRWGMFFLLSGLIVSAAPAGAQKISPHPWADAYFSVRDRARVLTAFDLGEVWKKPERFAGKLLEVRGTVSAVAGSDTVVSVLISTDENGSSLSVHLSADQKLTDWSFLDVGTTIRLLGKVVIEPETTTGAIELISAVPEKEAALADVTRKAAARIPDGGPFQELEGDERAQPPHISRLRSHSSDGFVDVYASALQYFHPRLSDDEATFIASRILAESVSRELDPRLLVAVIAQEGALKKSIALPRGIYVGSLTARVFVANLAADLARRLKQASGRKAPEFTAIRRAITDRRRATAPKGARTPAQLAAFTESTVRLYKAMMTEPEKQYHYLRFARPQWGKRSWVRPSAALHGTWSTGGLQKAIVVVNRSGSGVFGVDGEFRGAWWQSGPYLEFRIPKAGTIRFKWSVSDDRKALTLTRLDANAGAVGSFTLLRE